MLQTAHASPGENIEVVAGSGGSAAIVDASAAMPGLSTSVTFSGSSVTASGGGFGGSRFGVGYIYIVWFIRCWEIRWIWWWRSRRRLHLKHMWRTQQQACMACAAGTYNPNQGSSDPSACNLCPAGTLCPSASEDAPQLCTLGMFSQLPAKTTAPRVPQVCFLQILAHRHAAVAPLARTVIRAHRSSADATSTRTSPPQAPASAGPALCKL